MTTRQVKFKDPDGEILGGILVNDEFIICGCCGGVFEMEEVTILHRYPDWINISDEIKGEE